MYDTLNLWLPAQSITGLDYLNTVPTLLDNLALHTKAETNFYTGNLNGLNTCVSENGISIKGSICKFYLNDNIKTLNRQDTQRAIEMLSDTLNLPFADAYVNRIDLAQSFTVNNKPESYYDLFGDSTNYKRLTQPKSVYYSNGLRTKLFYNKIAEAKSKRVPIPEIWQNKNVLRYELRYTSRLPKQFNTFKVLAKNLYEQEFYIDMINRWANEYESINKLNEINLNLSIMNKPKDFFTQMALMKINEIGQNETLKLVEKLKESNCFEHKEYYSRLKAEIKKQCKAHQPEAENILITEINKKIKQAKEYYR